MKTVAVAERTISDSARQRMLAVRGEPLFYADWLRVVFIHFEVDPAALQRAVPFELDLHDGRAYVSLVAFTMRGMRPRLGGRFGALLFKPIATHHFLNVRAYVNHRGEPGIYFLSEWLSNPLAVRLGPVAFGLPYRLGRIDYQHRHEAGELSGEVEAADGSSRLKYRAAIDRGQEYFASGASSRDEFLMERYTAFTQNSSGRRFFRIWHPPWAQASVQVEIAERSLPGAVWPWFGEAHLIGANYSPGAEGVWMGRPHFMSREL